MDIESLTSFGWAAQQAVMAAAWVAGAVVAFRRWPAKGTGPAVAGFLLLASFSTVQVGVQVLMMIPGVMASAFSRDLLQWISGGMLAAGLAAVAGAGLTVYAFAAAWRARWSDDPRDGR